MADTSLLDLPDELLLQIALYSTPTSRITQTLTCRRLYHILKDVSKPTKPPSCLDLLLLEQIIPTPNRFTCTHCVRLLPRSSFIISQTRDRPKGQWPVPLLLQIETQGQADRKKYKFLFNRRFKRPRRTPSLWSAPDNKPTGIVAQDMVFPHPSRGFAAHEFETVPHAKIPSTARICIECGVQKKVWSPDYCLKFPTEDEGRAVGTGIICKRCGKFAVCKVDSKVMLRKECDACLVYRPPGTRWR